MPVRASEIAMAKIVTNGFVILVAALASLWLVVHLGLGVPIAGSIGLFVLGSRSLSFFRHRSGDVAGHIGA